MANPNKTIIECVEIILNSTNNYSEECFGFYENMRRWLDVARRFEPLI